MTLRILLAGIALCWWPVAAQPHLEKRGLATQLIVDGKPFLALGGELSNTISSDTGRMQTVWPMLAGKMHLNTVLTGVSWDWIEPEEGKYDFRLVDTLIEGARQNNVRIVWLWFGSWKNGLSSFAPAWVKAAQDRFPRAQIRNGKSIEVLSTLSQANLDADARAFAALMRHTREIDKTHRVIMVQVENEVGVLGDSRDRSPAADAAFAKPVPKELMDYLQQHKAGLLPEFRQVWEAAGSKPSGTWEEVFGKGAKADEIFMAWNYARYINRVAEAGKKEYPLPMYVNAWIVQPEDKGPGDYPSGGPQDHMHDIWRAGAPILDMLCPDIYLPGFNELIARYSRSGNPLFIPESFGEARGAANAFYAIGQFRAMGYSPFGIENTRAAAADLENAPLSLAYKTLAQLAPMILDHQSTGAIAAATLNRQNPDQQIKLGDYTLNVGLPRNVRTPNVVPDSTGYGLFMTGGPDEYWVAGQGLQITFTPNTPAPSIAGIARQEAGRFENGKWVVTRYLGGDDSVLRYDIGTVADMGQSGSGVRLTTPDWAIQRVQLYRYK
jgi:beta-galactosidase GanA